MRARSFFLLGVLVLLHFATPYVSHALNKAHNSAAAQANEGLAQKIDAPKWVDPGWVILDKTTYVRLDERGGYDATLEFSKKALTEQGAKALVEDKHNYNPNLESVTLENLATVKADGRVLPVDPIAILDRTADPSLPEPYLDDKRVKVIVFPDVGPGGIVRGRVTWHVRQSEFGRRFAAAYIQSIAQPIQNHRIVIDAPKGLAVQTKAIGASEMVETKGDRVIHTVVFPHRDPAPLVDAGDDFDVSPRYEVSTFRGWAEVARIVRAKNEVASQPDAVVGAKAKELVAGVADRRERVKRLYDWVAQNIRYVAIETGFGGFASMTAHQTFANRFGDCKAHVTLLKAMLAAIGEPAHMVLINVVPSYEMNDLPTPYFEHAILYVPSIDMYLDATSYQNPFGALPLPLADKPALDVETGAIVKIPLATPADVKVVAETHIDFAANGTAVAHTVMTGDKSGDGLRRAQAEELQTSDSRAHLRTMLSNIDLDGSGDFSFSNPRDLSAPLKLNADYKFNLHDDLDNLAKGVVLMTPVDWSAWLTWLIFENRFQTAARCAPIDVTDIVSATLPVGYNVPVVPPPLDYQEEAHGRTALGEVTGKIALHSSFTVSGRELKQTMHATFGFSSGLCDAHVIDRVWRAAFALDKYHRQGLGVTSMNASPMRLWLRSLLVKAHQSLE